MKEFYNYEEANNVIGEAWKLAIKHLENTLGDQYACNVSEYALGKFYDYIQQDITYKERCPRCENVVDEGEMTYGKDKVYICYDCHLKEKN